MSSPINPSLAKKIEDIGRNHIPSPDIVKAIAVLKNQPEELEIIPGIRPIWAAELKQMDIPPPSWIVDHLISANGISIISSKPGTYKTMLAIEISKCVSEGQPLFGVFETKQTKVLILDEESGNGRLKKREAILSADEANIATLSFAGVNMSEDYAKAIIRYCSNNSIGLVVFDSLTRFHAAQENASQEMSEVLSYYQSRYCSHHSAP
jgi:RecA-family ATPase